MSEGRRLPWDWYPEPIPANVVLPDDAYAETSYSFLLYRSEAEVGVRYARGAATYLGTMFDLGRRARVELGECALVHGAWFICDDLVTIGSHCMISWNVVFMDTYRVPMDPAARRHLLRALPATPRRRPDAGEPARPIHVGNNVWIGFNACVLPGVTIGDGAIVGCQAVVTGDVEPYTVVAGNPARQVKRLPIPKGPSCS